MFFFLYICPLKNRNNIDGAKSFDFSGCGTVLWLLDNPKRLQRKDSMIWSENVPALIICRPVDPGMRNLNYAKN